MSLLTGYVGAAGDAGRVDGTLEVGGRAVRLNHVLVVSMGDEEGLEGSPRLRIFLSDAEIPLRYATGASTMGAKAWARSANATAAVVIADPSGNAQGGVLVALGSPGTPAVAGSMSSNDGLTPFKVAGGRASGVASFQSASGVLKARLDALVLPAPATQDLKDKAVADSAPAKALLAYRAALKKGDAKEATRYATASRMKLLDDLRSESASGYAAMMSSLPTARR